MIFEKYIIIVAQRSLRFCAETAIRQNIDQRIDHAVIECQRQYHFLPPRGGKKKRLTQARIENTRRNGGLSSTHARKKIHGKYRIANIHACAYTCGNTRPSTSTARQSFLSRVGLRVLIDVRVVDDGTTGRGGQNRGGGSIRGNPDNDVSPLSYPPGNRKDARRDQMGNKEARTRPLRDTVCRGSGERGGR